MLLARIECGFAALPQVRFYGKVRDAGPPVSLGPRVHSAGSLSNGISAISAPRGRQSEYKLAIVTYERTP